MTEEEQYLLMRLESAELALERAFDLIEELIKRVDTLESND